MGVFDGVDIQGNGLTVTLQRANGPLEGRAHQSDGTTLPTAGFQRVGGEGLGLAASGSAYFQAGGADRGEDAELLVDPDDNSIWLEVT